MGEKDIISKEVIRHLAVDLATYLLGLDIDPESLHLIETEQQRVEDRRADLVARVREKSGQSFILHIEIQNNNDSTMPLRMLRYLTDISLRHPNELIRQHVIYIGREKLRMPAGIDQEHLVYDYGLLDMRKVDCQQFFQQNNPDALVLAILCDFGGQDQQQMVNQLFSKLDQLIGDNPKRLREYIRMIEILSDNRDLKHEIKEAEKMLTQVKLENMPSYSIGLEKGLEQGMEQGIEQGLEQGLEQGRERGEAKLLIRVLEGRFGKLDDALRSRIENSHSTQLEGWADRVLTADSLGDVFS